MIVLSIFSIHILLLFGKGHSSVRDNYSTRGNELKPSENNNSNNSKPYIYIVKCCEAGEILLDGNCEYLRNTNETQPWQPEFESEDTYEGAKPIPTPNYELKIGPPNCQSHEKQWDVYYDNKALDKLVMLPSGKLRHYVSDQADEVEKRKESYGNEFFDLDDNVQAKSKHHDYAFGHYCVDKVILTRDKIVATYARVCVPEVKIKWEDPDFLLKKAINPAFHAIAIISYFIVAVVYFVLPQLRDLVGNILTSMSLCLIVNQIASLIRIFTEFGNHINFMIADSVMYISLLAAFFWLNSLGYYIWITFRSRNVFLRVTDTRKYCCYSSYVWGSTISIAATAIFAHCTLETNKPTVGGTTFDTQETLGWLALSVIFMSIFFTIMIDLSFVLNTSKRMKSMRTYGRIHHKMKYSFKMFVVIYGLMTLSFISTLLSQLEYDGLLYFQIIINSFQGKTCNCCTTEESPEGLEWGEEMTAMNAGY